MFGMLILWLFLCGCITDEYISVISEVAYFSQKEISLVFTLGKNSLEWIGQTLFLTILMNLSDDQVKRWTRAGSPARHVQLESHDERGRESEARLSAVA